MIEHDYKELFSNDSIDKQLVIATDDGVINITNTELHENSFELNESISSGNSLKFGTVISSSVKFTVSNVFTGLKNKWITVTMSMNHNVSNPFKFGRYKAYSDIPTADRKKRDIVAYDALYDVLQEDVSEWYNTLLPNENSTATLKEFRDSFFSHFGIEQEEAVLINDVMIVTKTIQPEKLSGKTVINAICEINGCFGHIGRNGKFKYIYLTPIQEGLYPSEKLYPSENLYPAEPNTNLLKTGHYISAAYEDFIVEKIDKLQIRQEEDEVGAIIGSGNNIYVIQDNFLLYGKTEEELQTIGQYIFSKIGGIYYRPFSAKAKGNPCLEVGDGISLSTKYMAIHSYILQRTLTGIQALRDEYTAEGTQYQPSEVNSTARSIQQLKGRTNKLIRTVDETRLEMADIEKELYSTISVTAKDLRTEFTDTANGLQSQITQNANAISLRVTSSEFESEIKLLNNRISIRITEDEAQTLIDASIEGIILSASQIRLEGYTTINGGFSIDESGNATIENEYAKVFVDGYGLDVIRKDTEEGSSYGASAISHYGIQWMTVVNAGTTGVSRYIMLGSPSKKINDIYVTNINGKTPITTGNIGNYIPDTSDFVSISNFNSLEKEVSYNTRYIITITGSLDVIGNEIADLQSRVSALESK